MAAAPIVTTSPVWPRCIAGDAKRELGAQWRKRLAELAAYSAVRGKR